MTKEFVPYEQALALKELGFDEPCFGRYIYDGRGKEWFLVQTQQTKNASVIFEGDISVDGISVASPLYQQAFRWFREKHGLDSFVKDLYKSTIKVGYYFGIDKYKGIEFQMDLDDYYKTYEEAELECLKKLIEIVKQK
jgi:hypothetical protein